MSFSRATHATLFTVLVAVFGSAPAGCNHITDGDSDGESDDGPGNLDSEVVSRSQISGLDMLAGEYSLTYDDGPSTRTAELANWLADRGIVATFFINGKNAPGRDQALAAIVDRGHVLANHTQNHVDMRQLSGTALLRAVADTDAVIAARQPNGPWLLRAPFGAWDARVANELNTTAMKKYVGTVFWNVGGQLTATTAADWACWSQGVSVQSCANKYVSEMQVRGRGIVLLHDSHSATVDMTKIIVPKMVAQGARFVPLTKAPQIAAQVGGGGGLVSFEPTPRPTDGPFNALLVKQPISAGQWITQCTADGEKVWQSSASGPDPSARWGIAKYPQASTSSCGNPSNGTMPIVFRSAGVEQVSAWVVQCAASGVQHVFHTEEVVDNHPAAKFLYDEAAPDCP